MAFDATKHSLVPKHIKLSDQEKEDLLKKFHTNIRELPKILKDDAAIVKLNAKAGDIIKIERHSRTAGVTAYYRAVVEE